MEQYRDQFPVTKNYAYLDHASSGPASRRVLQAIDGLLMLQAKTGSLCEDALRAARERTRRKVAQFIGASADEIAFTKNTTDGLNIVAQGIQWKRGDNIIAPDVEFGGNVYPWMNLRDRGVEIRLVPTRGGVVETAKLIDAMTARTRLVAISWVEFHSGYRNDLRRIGAACRERRALLAVDGAQAIGLLACDVDSMSVDFMAFSAQKWLLGPQAVGVLYCRRKQLEALRVAAIGQMSMIDSASFLDYQPTLKSTAARLEPGSLNDIGIGGLEAAIDLLVEVGAEAIERRVLGLTRQLRETLDALRCDVLGSQEAAEQSGIVAFCHHAISTHAVRARLLEAHIVVAEREGFVRVSPHFYNTEDEVERLVSVLTPLVR